MTERTKQEDEMLRVDIGEENLRRVERRQDERRTGMSPVLGMGYGADVYARFANGPDKIVNAVCLKFQGRSAFGLSKYPTTLCQSKESRLAFLNHAQQEAMDLANYLEVLIQREEADESDP